MSEDYESEFAASGKVDSVTSCLLNVDAADVLVCILDRRYGPPLPENHQYPNISATHAEVLHAQSKGKPIFTFVRERSYIDHEQILADRAFDPKWIDKKAKDQVTDLIKAQRNLAQAITEKRSNWFDQFKASIDLKPLVLKRLLNEFPAHVGAFARKPDRIVRLFFRFTSTNPRGSVSGTFVNAGNGPALDIACGWSTGDQDLAWHTQGAVPVGAEVGSRDHGTTLTFTCPPSKDDLYLYCEYENASGDRYRVEAPLRWTNTGYKREGAERFLVRVGKQWLPA
jgi:hypothetical protein